MAAAGDNCIDYYRDTGRGYPGGNPVNVAVYLQRYGCAASYIGAVGNDKYGNLIRTELISAGIDVSHLRTEHGSTAISYLNLVDGERIFDADYEEGVMENFRLNDADIEFIARHDLLVSGVWGHTMDDLARIHEKGMPVAFDFSTEWQQENLDRAASYTDYAFFSSDGKDRDIIPGFMKHVKAMGPKIVVMTMGSDGSLVYDGYSFTEFGIIDCPVVDTMGAGDSYIAGFLAGIMEGKEISECMRKGAEGSALTIGYRGAWKQHAQRN